VDHSESRFNKGLILVAGMESCRLHSNEDHKAFFNLM